MQFSLLLTHKCNLACPFCYDTKNSQQMSSEIFDLAIDYIKENIIKNEYEDLSIQYIGGEVGLYNQERVLDSIKSFKTIGKDIRFLYQTNLVYAFTEKHLAVFNNISAVSTSYDYGLRLKKASDKVLWFENIKQIQNLNIPVVLNVVITKRLIEEVSPESFIDFVLASGIKRIVINNQIKTNSGFSQPKNVMVREWLYRLFLEYEKIKKYSDLRINEFENHIESFNGKHNFIHKRCCNVDNRTILPNGDVIACPVQQNKPIFNIKTKEVYCKEETIIQFEKELNPQCKNCKYLKYCNGYCHLYPFDETGCSMPYKVYDRLQQISLITQGNLA